MNKQQVETIIDKLAGRCHCYDSCNPKFKHPVLLGDVLAKLAPEGIELVKYEGIIPSICEYLLAYWSECGIDKSLQEIIKQSEWGKCSNCKGNGRVEMLEHCKPCSGKGEVLESPEATELFEFLHQVTKELWN